MTYFEHIDEIVVEELVESVNDMASYCSVYGSRVSQRNAERVAEALRFLRERLTEVSAERDALREIVFKKRAC